MNNKSDHYIYGMHAVTSLLQHQAQQVKSLWLQQGNDKRFAEIIKLAKKHQIHIEEVDKRRLDQLDLKAHQGVVAICKPLQALSDHDLFELVEAKSDPLLVILDQVQDPHNLGAIIRTVNGLGADAVVICKNDSVGLTPTVMKVAAGALPITPVYQVTNLARTLQKLKDLGVWLVGLAGEADSDIYQQNFSGAMALIMGNEGEGLRRLTKEHCDFLCKIPMAGTVSSLNVSVATAITLAEAVRQRRKL